MRARCSLVPRAMIASDRSSPWPGMIIADIIALPQRPWRVAAAVKRAAVDRLEQSQIRGCGE